MQRSTEICAIISRMKVICFGDSLTSCGGPGGRFSDILQDRFPGHDFVNRGIGGQTFIDARERLQSDVLDENPDIVLVEFGANDWWQDERPPAAWAGDLEFMVENIRRTGAMAVVLGVFGPHLDRAGKLVEKTDKTDARAQAYRQMEAAIAREHGCLYVANIQERIIGDRCCWLDANHPNEYGNRHVADVIEPILQKLLRTKASPVRKPDLETTLDLWQEAVRLAADKLAVVDRDRRLTFGQAGAVIELLAAGLHRAAQVEAPRVAVFLPNCLEYFLVYWAVQRLGGVIVPLNTWLKEKSLRGIFAGVQPEILIVGSGADQAVLRAAAAAPAVRIFALKPGDSGLPAYASILEGTGSVPRTEMSGDDLSIIMHTSGTTATPKGALMRHSDLIFNVMASINTHGFVPGDVHLLVNPMFHCTALYSILPAAAYQKSPVVIVAGSSPDFLLNVIQSQKVTTFLSVPSVFGRMLSLRNLEQYDLASLRLMAYAGSPMPVETIRELHRRFPEVELRNFFGLTETISPTHVLRGEDLEEHPDSIGRLLPFVRAMIIDEGGSRLQPGQVGELVFARENVISGYHNQPQRLRDAMVKIEGEEWFATGDLAMVDEDGYFFIKGRKKDMIIVGGENVFAGEVEAVLLKHPGVREAAVKGVPARGARTFLGEQVMAFVVLADDSLTEADLRKYCYAELPSYKVPQEVKFLPELPRNPAGKVVKSELPG